MSITLIAVRNPQWKTIKYERLDDDGNVVNDADGNPQQGSVYGSISLDVSDLSSFTAFDSVTASNVQGWVESALGSDEVTSLKSGIDAQIAEKVTPTKETKTIGS